MDIKKVTEFVNEYKIVLLVGSIVLLFGIVGVAVLPDTEDDEDTEMKITGTVVNSYSEEPIENATVELDNQETTTDENGEFTFTGEAEDEYTVEANADGYAEWFADFEQDEIELLIQLRPVEPSTEAPEQLEQIFNNTDGSGSEDNPHIITTVDELQAVTVDPTANWKLGNDIDASVTSEWNPDDELLITETIDSEQQSVPVEGELTEIVEATTTESETPVEVTITDSETGSVTVEDDINEPVELTYRDTLNESFNRGFTPIDEFTGTFDGNGHEITGLTINQPDKDEVGLFNRIDDDATVENVELSNTDITGRIITGGLVGGVGDATVENSSVTGQVTGEITVGGLVGSMQKGDGQLIEQGSIDENGSVIKNSMTDAEVTGEGTVGGLVGAGYGTITESFATGETHAESIAGGLVGGAQELTIQNAYATGEVTGDFNVGGLVGIILDESTIKHTYSANSGEVDGLVGMLHEVDETDVTVTSSYQDTAETILTETNTLTTEEMQGDSAEANMDEFDFEDTWSTVEDDYPVLQVFE